MGTKPWLTEAPYGRPVPLLHAPPLLREPTGPRELSHPHTGRITRDLGEAEGSPSVKGSFTQQHAVCWWHCPGEGTRQPGVSVSVAGGWGECSPTPQLVHEVRPCRVGPRCRRGRKADTSSASGRWELGEARRAWHYGVGACPVSPIPFPCSKWLHWGFGVSMWQADLSCAGGAVE